MTIELPEAIAGKDQTGTANITKIQLDGSQSKGLLPIKFHWSLIAPTGEEVFLLNYSDTPNPSFTPEQSGTYEACLVITDAIEIKSSTSDPLSKVSIYVSEAPVANITIDPEIVIFNQQNQATILSDQFNKDRLIQISSENTTGDINHYSWKIIKVDTNQEILLENPNLADQQLFLEEKGEYLITLKVVDINGVFSTATTASLIIIPVTVAKIDLGFNEGVAEYTSFPFVGENSEGIIESYDWTIEPLLTSMTDQALLTPIGKSSFSNISNPNTTFIAGEVGEYRVNLTVTDCQQRTALATKKIIVEEFPLAEIITNRNHGILGHHSFTLTGQTNKTEGIQYQWEAVSYPSNADPLKFLDNINSVEVNFNPSVVGIYTIGLQITYQKNQQNILSEKKLTKINVASSPQAIISVNQNYIVLDRDIFILQADQNSIGDFQYTCNWKIISSPSDAPNQTNKFSSSTEINTNFTPEFPGEYQVQLEMNVVIPDDDDIILISNLISLKVYQSPTAIIQVDHTYDTITRDPVFNLDAIKSIGTNLTYAWKIAESSIIKNGKFSNYNQVNTSFTPLQEGDYLIELVVTTLIDNLHITSHPAIIILNVYEAPNADINVDYVFATLHHNAVFNIRLTELEGEGLNYQWDYAPKNLVASFSDSTAEETQFLPNEPGIYTISVIVTDINGAVSQPDTIDITVIPFPEVTAIINSTTATVGGTSLYLESVVNSDYIVNYLWQWEEKPTNMNDDLIELFHPQIEFIPMISGNYTLKLTVEDQNGAVANSNSISFSVAKFPVAVCSVVQNNVTLIKDLAIELIGKQSTGNENIDASLQYRWFVQEAPNENYHFSDSTLPDPKFYPGKAGDYCIALEVIDANAITSDVSSVNFTIFPFPQAMIAIDRIVTENTNEFQYQLDASKSTGKELTAYQWIVTPPVTDAIYRLSDPFGIKTLFVASTPGEYKICLIVKDINNVESHPNCILINIQLLPDITIVPYRDNPVGVVGRAFRLEARVSVDRDYSYNWQFISQPAGNTNLIMRANTDLPYFIPKVTGIYEVGLELTNSEGSAPVNKSIRLYISEDGLPLADAGENVSGQIGNPTILDASNSIGKSLKYQWIMESLPGNSTTVLIDDTTVHPTLIPDMAGEYIISLIVTDINYNISNPAKITVSVYY